MFNTSEERRSYQHRGGSLNSLVLTPSGKKHRISDRYSCAYAINTAAMVSNIFTQTMKNNWAQGMMSHAVYDCDIFQGCQHHFRAKLRLPLPFLLSYFMSESLICYKFKQEVLKIN
jgi:hypothetical protein